MGEERPPHAYNLQEACSQERILEDALPEESAEVEKPSQSPSLEMRKPQARRRILAYSLCALALILIILAGIALYLNTPPSLPVVMSEDFMEYTEEGAILFEVKAGETAQSVGRRLAQAGIIRSDLLWKLLFRMDQRFVKTGIYRLDLPLGQRQIREILVSGKQILLRVTIPEGATLKKTAQLYEQAGICTAEAFLEASRDREILSYYQIPGESMEGYLYPDTYLFTPGYPAKSLVKMMADTFFQRIGEQQPEAAQLSPLALNDRVILASIIEREYRLSEEAPLMAGVFYNRLSIGMALQSCATLEYIITEIQGKPHPTALYDQDTHIRNPYNTYLYPGLPPGPIASPGLVALNAAFHPAATDYLYFRLIDQTQGRHYFSRSFDEHIRASTLYVKGGLL